MQKQFITCKKIHSISKINVNALKFTKIIPNLQTFPPTYSLLWHLITPYEVIGMNNLKNFVTLQILLDLRNYAMLCNC